MPVRTATDQVANLQAIECRSNVPSESARCRYSPDQSVGWIMAPRAPAEYWKPLSSQWLCSCSCTCVRISNDSERMLNYELTRVAA
jgi:hypothetical protein